MGELLTFSASRQVGYEAIDDVPLSSDEVRICTMYSGISAGTEMTQYRGTNPYLSKRWDADRRLFLDDTDTSLTYPIRNLGYEEVGKVIECGTGVTGIEPGDLVFGTWGHRTHHVTNAEYVRPRLMPQGSDPITGIFSHIGAIAI